MEFANLANCWAVLLEDESVRCVVVTGAGDKAICSGANLEADFSEVCALDNMIDLALCKTRHFPKPVVAAINGHCVAGGFGLMLSTDIRIASEKAKLGFPEVHWGIVPSGGGAMKLIEQIGYAIEAEGHERIERLGHRRHERRREQIPEDAERWRAPQ